MLPTNPSSSRSYSPSLRAAGEFLSVWAPLSPPWRPDPIDLPAQGLQGQLELADRSSQHPSPSTIGLVDNIPGVWNPFPGSNPQPRLLESAGLVHAGNCWRCTPASPQQHLSPRPRACPWVPRRGDCWWFSLQFSVSWNSVHSPHSLKSAGSILSPVSSSLVTAGVHSSVSLVIVAFLSMDTWGKDGS